MGLRDVIAAVFYLAGGRVEGLARLQLVMYVLHKETSLVSTYFETWHVVPWSRDVEREVEELARDGLLSIGVDETTGVKTYTASKQLTERGAETYREIEERDPYVAHLMKLIVAYATSLPLSKLLLGIKLAYPETAQSATQLIRIPCVARKA
jgi:hypothetical protein